MNKIRIISLFFLVLFVITILQPVSALEIKNSVLSLNVKSAVLIDANTGTVLYSHNMNEALPPASVTKIMTLLLVFEEIEKNNLTFEDLITISEYAASMGGSQVYLEPGENMSVNELIKCVAVASANDAAVALAEHIGGSEEAFVKLMNEKAIELGMSNTHFENVTGLDDDVVNHLTSAYDIALMSRALLNYDKITDYTTIWMDTIRNGEFGLSNTNRLVRYYKGITGLKTGSTDKAGFCVSASAKRENLHLIAVIMGADTSNERNIAATKLLDFGFANYETYSDIAENCGSLKVYKGEKESVSITCNEFTALENKGNSSKIIKKIYVDDGVIAPVNQGDVVGTVTYCIGDTEIGRSDIVATERIDKISYWKYYFLVINNLLN